MHEFTAAMVTRMRPEQDQVNNYDQLTFQQEALTRLSVSHQQWKEKIMKEGGVMVVVVPGGMRRRSLGILVGVGSSYNQDSLFTLWDYQRLHKIFSFSKGQSELNTSIHLLCFMITGVMWPSTLKFLLLELTHPWWTKLTNCASQ